MGQRAAPREDQTGHSRAAARVSLPVVGPTKRCPLGVATGLTIFLHPNTSAVRKRGPRDVPWRWPPNKQANRNGESSSFGGLESIHSTHVVRRSHVVWRSVVATPSEAPTGDVPHVNPGSPQMKTRSLLPLANLWLVQRFEFACTTSVPPGQSNASLLTRSGTWLDSWRKTPC